MSAIDDLLSRYSDATSPAPETDTEAAPLPSTAQLSARYLEEEANKLTAAEHLAKLLGQIYPDIKNAGEARAKFEAETGPEPVSKTENIEATALGAAKTMFPAAAGIATAVAGGPIGLLASLPVGYLAAKGQSKALEAWHPGAQKEIQQVAEEHPLADFIGELLPALAAGRPGRPESLKVAAVGAGLGAGLNAVGSVMEGEAPTLKGLGFAGLLGAFLKPYGFLHGPTPKGAAPRPPVETADPNVAKGPFIVPNEAPYEPTVKNGKPVPPAQTVPTDARARSARQEAVAAEFAGRPEAPLEPSVVGGKPVPPKREAAAQPAKPSPEQVSTAMLNLSEQLKANPPSPLPGSPEFQAAHPAADPAVEATSIYRELVSLSGSNTKAAAARTAELTSRLDALGVQPDTRLPEPSLVKTVPKSTTTAPAFDAEAEGAKYKRIIDLQDAYDAMEREFGRPLSTPEANMLGRLEEQAHADGEPNPAASAVAMAKALPPPPGPETMPVAQAMAEGVSPEEYAGSVKVAFAEGRPIHPEAAASVPEVQNAQEVFSQLPEFSAEDIRIAQAEAEAVRAEARGEDVAPAPTGVVPTSKAFRQALAMAQKRARKGIATTADRNLLERVAREDARTAIDLGEVQDSEGGLPEGAEYDDAPQTRQDAPGAAEPRQKGPWQGEARPAIPGAVPGYDTARALHEPVRQSWAEAEEMVRAVGGEPALLKDGTAPQLLAHAYRATQAQTAALKASLKFNADPSQENAVAFKAALKALEGAMEPLQGKMTETAQALTMARAVKGVEQAGTDMLSVSGVAETLGKGKKGRGRGPQQAPRMGGGPRGRRGGGFGARGGAAAPPPRRYTKAAQPVPDEEMRFLLQASSELSRMKTPADVANMARARVPRKALTPGQKVGAGVWEYIRNSLLSSPSVLAKKTLGDVTMMLVQPIETAVSVPVGYARRGVSAAGSLLPSRAGKAFQSLGRGDRTYMAEVPAEIAGMITAVPDAIRVAAKRYALEATDNPFVEGTHPEPIIPGKLGKVIRIPQKNIGFVSDTFGGAQRGGAVNALAVRHARSEGLSGKALTDRIAYLLENPGSVQTGITRQGNARGFLSAQANAVAAENTFISKNALGNMLGRAKAYASVKGFPLLGPIIPFVNVRLNIMSQALKRTPAGILLPSTMNEIKAGGASFDRAVARIGLGAGAMMALVYHVKKGHITGPRPDVGTKEFNEQAAKDTAGSQPDSIRFGDQWIKLHSIPVIGDFARLAYNYVAAHDKMPDNSAISSAASMADALGKWLMNTSFTEDFANVFDAIDGNAYARKRFFKSIVTEPIPRALSSVALALDPNIRRADVAINSWKDVARLAVVAAQAQIPGLRNRLESYRDLYGTETKAGGPAVLRALGQASTTVSKDPVRTELVRLKMRLEKPERTIYGHTMESAEFEAYQEDLGKAAYEAVQGHMGIWGTWHSMSDEDQRVAIKQAFHDARKTKRLAWAEDHPTEYENWQAAHKRKREGYDE